MSTKEEREYIQDQFEFVVHADQIDYVYVNTILRDSPFVDSVYLRFTYEGKRYYVMHRVSSYFRKSFNKISFRRAPYNKIHAGFFYVHVSSPFVNAFQSMAKEEDRFLFDHGVLL